jgi:hypothetical protein
MKWVKKGLIYCPQGKHGFDVTHAHKPTPLLIDKSTVRVYFGTRDIQGRTRTTFIDLEIDNFSNYRFSNPQKLRLPHWIHGIPIRSILEKHQRAFLCNGSGFGKTGFGYAELTRHTGGE